MSTLPPRHVVCDNPECIYEGQLRQVYPIRIGRDLFTYPPATCGCRSDIELRITTAPRADEVITPELGKLPEEWGRIPTALPHTIEALAQVPSAAIPAIPPDFGSETAGRS